MEARFGAIDELEQIPRSQQQLGVGLDSANVRLHLFGVHVDASDHVENVPEPCTKREMFLKGVIDTSGRFRLRFMAAVRIPAARDVLGAARPTVTTLRSAPGVPQSTTRLGFSRRGRLAATLASAAAR
jgi:hypothetical protein